MNTFDIAVEKILDLEGGFVDDPKDPGGKTKYGISQKSFPNINIGALTKEKAIAIYKKHYWDTNPFYDQIKSQYLTVKLFITAINMGQKPANICLQRAMRSFKYLEQDDSAERFV